MRETKGDAFLNIKIFYIKLFSKMMPVSENEGFKGCKFDDF